MTALASTSERGPVVEVLDALASHGCQPRRSGNGWTARCPAHEDRWPSLGVSEGADGRALVFCHAGCSIHDVLAALDLTVRDLFPRDVERRFRPAARRGRRRATRADVPLPVDAPLESTMPGGYAWQPLPWPEPDVVAFAEKARKRLRAFRGSPIEVERLAREGARLRLDPGDVEAAIKAALADAPRSTGSGDTPARVAA